VTLGSGCLIAPYYGKLTPDQIFIPSTPEAGGPSTVNVTNDQCYDHNLFPSSYTVHRTDRQCTNKARGGGVLTAVLTA
jgi:hypothetical protein